MNDGLWPVACAAFNSRRLQPPNPRRIFSAFRKKEVGDFWVDLIKAGKIQVDANSQVTVSFENGKVVNFHIDSPPPVDAKEK